MLGVQDSMYRMGLRALKAVPEISEVAMAMPNLHYIPTNLSHFKLDNPGVLFFPTNEPHGQIECTVGRASKTHQRATGALRLSLECLPHR